MSVGGGKTLEATRSAEAAHASACMRPVIKLRDRRNGDRL